MTNEEREKFRWEIARQVYLSHWIKTADERPAWAVGHADALISALEASAPKAEICEHEWVRMTVDRTNIADISNWVGPEHCQKCEAIK